MTIRLTWLGHGGWSMEIAGQQVLLDPFLSDNPTAPCGPDDVQAAVILVSHGHFDHVADVGAIARRTGAQVVAAFEVAQWLQKKERVENPLAMNHGGWATLPFGRVKMTPAIHSSSMPDGSYGGNPGGFLIEAEEKRLYFACDTALFSDMRLIGRPRLDLAVLPIGDLFTMGPEDSLEAIEWLQPKQVAPAHYNTWPPIEQDADRWAAAVREKTSAEPVVLQPGESFTV